MGQTGSEPAFSLPHGTVTFMLTDIAGSTKAWQADPDATASVVHAYYATLDEVISRHGGARPVEQGEGDSVVGVFTRAADAVSAALDAQRVFLSAGPDVRIALHTGDAELRDEGNYFGPAIIRCARLRAVAAPHQVLLSGATADLVADRLPDGATLADLGTHRLKDLERPERVWALRHDDLALVDDSPVRADTPATNLPTQLSSFIGRAAELAELRELLPATRMLTLTGVGGCGKTRLALHVAASVVEQHPGGVWLAELAPIADADRVTASIALALGETDLSGDLVEALVTRLGEQTTLLVWDNCEHILNVTAELADALLRRCPGLRIMATSREPLGVPGEVAWRVPSLTLPARDLAPAVDAVSGSDAVRLFVDRARRARPNFELTAANAAAVVQICDRLDGIPLAIELAAARVRAMTPEQVASGLDDRFRLLTGGSRTFLPRQQTLHASVDWGYGLLSPREQAALRRLSVFAASFDLEAAESVVAGDDIDPVEVLDLVLALTDKSMLDVDDDTGRYRMLETIRQYGAARLVDSGETTDARDRHLAWVVALHDPYASLFLDVGDDEVVARSIDDYRAALEWALATEATDHARQVASALARWETAMGDADQAIAVCTSALALDGGDRRIELLTKVVLVGAGVEAGTALTTRELRDELAAEVGAIDDDLLRGLVLLGTSFGAFFSDIAGPGGAREMFERVGREDLVLATYALEASRQIVIRGGWRRAEELAALVPDDAARAPIGNRNMVMLHAAFLSGRFDRARSTIGRMHPAGSLRVSAFRAAGIVLLDLAQGVDSGAHAELETVIAAASGRHSIGSIYQGGYALGTWELVHGDPASAAAILRGWVGQTPLQLRLVYGIWHYAQSLLAVGADDELAALLESLSALDGRPNLGGVQHAHLRSALARRRGDLPAAEQLEHQALAIAHDQGLRPAMVECLEALAGLAAAQRADVEAARLYGAAAAMRDDMGYVLRWPYEAAQRDTDLASVRGALGEPAFAEAEARGRALDDDAAFGYATRSRGERGRPSAGWDSLTPTEAQVAALAAGGKTNREIAEQLLMGTETVKTHLGRVYDKLGVRGRTELAAAHAQR